PLSGAAPRSHLLRGQDRDRQHRAAADAVDAGGLGPFADRCGGEARVRFEVRGSRFGVLGSGFSVTSLRSSRVWLTGASSGIGAALAGVLVERGARVAITARRLDLLNALATA